MKSWAKQKFLKIQMFKIFDTVDCTQFLISTRERKKEYAKLLLFKLKWPILSPSASSLFRFSLVKKAKNLIFLNEVNCKNEEVLEVSMKMTFSITNKLVENLFQENKCFFHCLVVFKVQKISGTQSLG